MSFRSTRTDGGEIDSRTRPFRLDHRCDRRRGVRTGSQLVAVIDDERLAGIEREIATRQLGECSALLVKCLNHAGPFGLVRSEIPAEAAGRPAYHVGGSEQAGFEPGWKFFWIKTGGCAEFLCGHRRNDRTTLGFASEGSFAKLCSLIY